MSDAKGIYRKFEVKRSDGSSGPGSKHEHCAYFVLDLEHDEYAIPALRAYADACRASHPELAADIDKIVVSARSRCSCREVFCPHSMSPDGPSTTANALMEKS